MTARVYLSLGSNIEPRRHLRDALCSLRAKFGELLVSPVYESRAVGFEGANFLNLVVGIDVALPVGELSRALRTIEEEHGRQRGLEKFSSRTLDIDILTYGQVVGVVDGISLPRDEIETYPFVIRPLADIDPAGRYPVDGRSYGNICSQVATDPGALWRVDLDTTAD